MRNLLFAGGTGHAFDASAAYLVDLWDELGISTTVVPDPDAGFAALRRAESGAGRPFDLVAVNGLWWRMEAARYAHLRDSCGYVARPEDLAALDGFVRNGGGLIALHTAVVCFDADPSWRMLCGAAWDWERSSHPPLGRADVGVTEAGRTHELTRGLEDFVIDDEIYGSLDLVEDIVALLTGTHSGQTHPLLWCREVGRGRVVNNLLGHATTSLAHPAHRTILLRAASWVTRMPTTPSPGLATAP